MTEPVVRQPVVVGVDGSTTAVQAVRWAAREAARRQKPLVIAHYCVLVPMRAPDYPELSQSYAESVAVHGRQWLDEAAAAARAVAPEVEVITELTGGGAAEHLVGRSATAELVVLGSRGSGGGRLRRWKHPLRGVR